MSSKQKERNQNIKVFVRVRPRNTLELRSHIVVDCISNKEIAIKDKGQTKTFGFDRVFGPESKQVDVYKIVVSPLISEVLQGYNCTVFAYGQTGTGKTFTMVGDRTKDLPGGWENDPLCGIVPRTLDHLFDELKVRAEEYTVRVSFLELYNEELCDLLARGDDDTKSLRLFEDALKKGSVIVSGLEERTVYEKNDVYPILEAGSLRRQTAPTLMNAQSSRSHTIFTITVHVKVTTPEGEELFKTGKLNLVDLAGSENIGRSGAVDIRAREAGNINQSLLTLGRVITSLVERTPHIPYRESKLTRILQDSLGGRTKTSIIATVSPALCNLEETLSTCDYAHRARNITNKPEINQKTSKQVLLKNYTDEIERLRRDLLAAREKHGVYLLNEDYTSMLSQIDSLNRELVNKIQLLKVREDELAKQEDIMQSLNTSLYATKTELDAKLDMLRISKEALNERECALQELNKQAQVLLNTASEATDHSRRLHDRLDRARMVHSHNQQVEERFRDKFCANLSTMKAATESFRADILAKVDQVKDTHVANFLGCREHEAEIREMVASYHQKMQTYAQQLKNCYHPLVETVGPAITNQMEAIRSMSDSLDDLIKEHATRLMCNLSDREELWTSVKRHVSSVLEKELEVKNELFAAITALEETKDALNDFPKIIAEKNCTEEKKLKQLQSKKMTLTHHLEELRLEQGELEDRQNEIVAKQNEYRMEQDKLLARQNELMAGQNELMSRQNEILARHNCLRKSEQEKLAELEVIEKQLRVSKEQASNMLLKNISCHAGSNVKHAETILGYVRNGIKKADSILLDASELLPSILRAHEDDKEETESVHTYCSTELSNKAEHLKTVCHQQDETNSVISMLVESSEGIFDELKATLDSTQADVTSLAADEDQRLTETDESIRDTMRVCVSNIVDFCEKSFANIHDRSTEIKIHFKDELLRDEKTGNTPQRKDFVYPKRLIPVSKLAEDSENVPPLDFTRTEEDGV